MDSSTHKQRGLVVGIDATNLRAGGGVTHLIELLNAASPARHGLSKVVIWGGQPTLAKLPERTWLEKRNPSALNQGLLQRTMWQRLSLARAARAANCDVLFVPGGSNYAAGFHPVVTMSRNLLPFEWQELLRYGRSIPTLKLLVLRQTQSHTFRSVDGVIFLTEYARQSVQKQTGPLTAMTATVPHGLNPRFQITPRPQQPISAYSDEHPYRLLYVSIIDQYKHQWHLVEAVHRLRGEGYPLALDLVGPSYPPALSRLNEVVERLDPERRWVHYHGAVPYQELHKIYGQTDLGVFASSCENMPNILLETMAAGLPIACSNRGPMPEVLGNAGCYFDPENVPDIARSLRSLISSPELRAEKSLASFDRCKNYSWERCADQTFEFLASAAKATRRSDASVVDAELFH